MPEVKHDLCVGGPMNGRIMKGGDGSSRMRAVVHGKNSIFDALPCGTECTYVRETIQFGDRRESFWVIEGGRPESISKLIELASRQPEFDDDMLETLLSACAYAQGCLDPELNKKFAAAKRHIWEIVNKRSLTRL